MGRLLNYLHFHETPLIWKRSQQKNDYVVKWSYNVKFSSQRRCPSHLSWNQFQQVYVIKFMFMYPFVAHLTCKTHTKFHHLISEKNLTKFPMDTCRIMHIVLTVVKFAVAMVWRGTIHFGILLMIYTLIGHHITLFERVSSTRIYDWPNFHNSRNKEISLNAVTLTDAPKFSHKTLKHWKNGRCKTDWLWCMAVNEIKNEWIGA